MTPTYRVRVLYDEASVARRVDELAGAIVQAAAPDLLAVAVLKGSFVFAADLIRALHRAQARPQVEFIHLANTGPSAGPGGHVAVLRDVESDVTGRDVLLVDDILQSGRKLSFAKDLMAARGARRVLTVVLLEKKGKRAVRIDPDFVGFACPNVFVVGYGMDVGHRFRELPFIGTVAHGQTDPDLFDARSA